MSMIEFLQQFDFDWLILSMKAITILGNEEFYLLVLPVLIWCWRKTSVLPLVILLLLNFWINYEFKEFFHLARPEGVNLISAEHYGFPSGHAQGAMVLWGYLAWLLNRVNGKQVYGWFGLIIVFIGLSRIYLGVHFPSDVIGGWSIGFVILFIGIRVVKIVEARKLKFPTIPTVVLVGFVGLMLALLRPSDISVRAGGMLAGLVGGMLVELEYLKSSLAARWWQNALKIIIGVAGILILKIGIKMILPELLWADWLRYGIIGLWMGFGAPLVFAGLRLRKN
ncbi:MAG: phosphatase PAP2 family protein [Candidatus Marinimicrobia bacterium]|nr:phosphatase PAP2 family protein [Candidatus Neomarinimicrobiota bacterium]